MDKDYKEGSACGCQSDSRMAAMACRDGGSQAGGDNDSTDHFVGLRGKRTGKSYPVPEKSQGNRRLGEPIVVEMVLKRTRNVES